MPTVCSISESIMDSMEQRLLLQLYLAFASIQLNFKIDKSKSGNTVQHNRRERAFEKESLKVALADRRCSAALIT